MIESTFETPITVLIQPMEPVVDDEGVTSVSVLMITTAEGSTRRFVFTIDDLHKVVAIIERTLS